MHWKLKLFIKIINVLILIFSFHFLVYFNFLHYNLYLLFHWFDIHWFCAFFTVPQVSGRIATCPTFKVAGDGRSLVHCQVCTPPRPLPPDPCLGPAPHTLAPQTPADKTLLPDRRCDVGLHHGTHATTGHDTWRHRLAPPTGKLVLRELQLNCTTIFLVWDWQRAVE